jgi:hypothetical protein
MNPFDEEMLRALARELESQRRLERLRQEYRLIEENSTLARLMREAVGWDEK